ncbi:JDVT-CTERM system glutamic-type intramembrane protease MrtJ [Halioxenophilus sp. WMMB6]|uniref:JDVT-CTERM system glutamic-type intramembrane protease MrtJ n=1 Tax=Halioxenophilus sp. WMMB6 TaxID=3073815 RepID=UPI00295E60C7|nr:JDVT-CTERM system glutamic-type intramembrane protease [Halioxenophilus sp. WMMB6]
MFWAALCAAFFIDIVIAFNSHFPERSVSGWQVLLLILVYPVLEEIVFRGLLQSLLLKATGSRYCLAGVSYANLMAALLFALAHLPRVGGLFALWFFLPGLVFGFFRDRTGNLLPAILLHILFNSIWFLVVEPLRLVTLV